MPLSPATRPPSQETKTPLPSTQRPKSILRSTEPAAGLIHSSQARRVPLSHGGDPGPVRVLLLSRAR